MATITITTPVISFSGIKSFFVRIFKAMIEARQLEANRRIAMMQLSKMSDRELHDIGIGRGDIYRVVHDETFKRD